MYTHPNQIPQGYYSLNNSIALSPTHSHNRTQSTNRIIPTVTFKPEHARAPSQKKLTLTCQNPSLLGRPTSKQIDNSLKKRAGECKGKFVSLQASRVGEAQVVETSQEKESQQLIQVKRMFRDKLRQLQTAYSHSLSEQSNKIRQLQVKLLGNSRELQVKQRKIIELQALCRNYQLSFKDKDIEHNNAFMSQKIADIQAKIKVLVGHFDQTNVMSLEKIDLLTKKIVSLFGSRLQQLKCRIDKLLRHNFNKIADLQSQIQILKIKNQRHSQGTRGSMESVGSEPPSFNFNSHQDQGGMSFWDDCFFYPSEHSQNYELVLQMAKRRDQPLSVWIDHQEYLRYTDTNSYLYNLKGDRIRLEKQEIIELVSEKILIIC